MKRIRFIALMLMTIVAVSAAHAQNEVIYMLTFDADDYDWYTYNMKAPEDKQVLAIKVTEYTEFNNPELNYKVEKTYYYDIITRLLTQVGKVRSNSTETLEKWPLISAYTFNYTNGNENLLTSCTFSDTYGKFTRYFYDNMGRISKWTNYYTDDNTELEGESMMFTYGNSSNIIKTFSYTNPLRWKEIWTSDVKFSENTLTIEVLPSSEVEYKKVDNRC